MTKAIVGIIGGSGVYHLPGLEEEREEHVSSPWGEPSDALRFGRIGGTEAVFLPRHGRGHRLAPNGINYRANIDALKQVGVTDLISVSACGSFKQELPPGTFVIVDQFVDRTVGRESSFFGNGCVAHVSMAHPVSSLLAARCLAAAEAEGIEARGGGTYVCMEGPQFSSLAESLLYKASGFDVIGMTAMPEAKLAREAELSYAIDRHGHRFRLLAPGPCRRRRRLGDRGGAGERRQGGAAAGAPASRFPRRARALSGRLGHGARHGTAHRAGRSRPRIIAEARNHLEAGDTPMNAAFDLLGSIRTIPDYPKPGILFRDITTLLGDAKAFRRAIDELVQPWAGTKIDKVAGIEARGFILGGAMAHQLSAGFVPIRKKGKLPHTKVSIAYSLEYGIDEMEMHADAVGTRPEGHPRR